MNPCCYARDRGFPFCSPDCVEAEDRGIAEGAVCEDATIADAIAGEDARKFGGALAVHLGDERRPAGSE